MIINQAIFVLTKKIQAIEKKVDNYLRHHQQKKIKIKVCKNKMNIPIIIKYLWQKMEIKCKILEIIVVVVMKKKKRSKDRKSFNKKMMCKYKIKMLTNNKYIRNKNKKAR